MSRRTLDWKTILATAREIVISYDTLVTLRQLHYRLVSVLALGYPNTHNTYKGLSKRTADGRRDGTFPHLIDLTRTIEESLFFTDMSSALDWLVRIYRLDRTEGQEIIPVVIAEKATVVAQLATWIGEPYSIPIVPLRGYQSESFERAIRQRFSDHRTYRVLYIGDWDSSGVDIERNAVGNLGGVFESWQRICLTAEQVERYRLPVAPGKTTDARAASFLAAHGQLAQVEVEALDPDDLRQLVLNPVMDGWDMSAYRLVTERERAERAELEALLGEA